MGGQNGRSWSTSDLGTAAFVHMRGLEILGATKTGGRGFQWVFRFSDPKGQGDSLQVKYLNSDCRSFDSAVRSLKKLCYDHPR